MRLIGAPPSRESVGSRIRASCAATVRREDPVSDVVLNVNGARQGLSWKHDVVRTRVRSSHRGSPDMLSAATVSMAVSKS